VAIRRRYDNIEENFGAKGWKEELKVINRQRKSVFLVFALMIVMAAFWENFWTWTVFFSAMALYSLFVGVRIGFVCGVSFAIWFLALREWPIYFAQHKTFSQVIGLWCLGTLFLLVVWKADEKTQLLKLQKELRSEEGG
jgi:hypothetical protein